MNRKKKQQQKRERERKMVHTKYEKISVPLLWVNEQQNS